MENKPCPNCEKLCINCEYVMLEDSGYYYSTAICYHPEMVTVSVVDGSKKGTDCVFARHEGKCHEEGKFFKKRPDFTWRFWK